ncbi:competence type IV pilus minor pilin ComGG [Lactococcus taiwanensis]|uniref:competence type IV pilus minor pilin ComGG n=1 Tax=Lactococcus taiwanensis TaxID=1151742 RepID=UPI0023F17DB6|nr:competence type IV pilus minor pilin ComGG [Lactococcus taiwanensis]
MLYALVLSLIFGLVLQFYLQEQLAVKKQRFRQKDRLTAELMVLLIQKNLPKKSQTVYFKQGQVTYQITSAPSEHVAVTDQTVSNSEGSYIVHLTDGSDFIIKK